MDVDESPRERKILAVVKRNDAGKLASYRNAKVGPGDLVTFLSIPTGVVALVGPIEETDPELVALLTQVSP